MPADGLEAQDVVPPRLAPRLNVLHGSLHEITVLAWSCANQGHSSEIL